MNRRQAFKVMRKALSALTKTQKARLVWHARNKTPILCGENASLFASGGGG